MMARTVVLKDMSEHLKRPTTMAVPDDHELQPNELEVSGVDPEDVWDAEQERVRTLFEAEKLERAKDEHKQRLYQDGLVKDVSPLMRGNTPDEWQDELFGRMLRAQLTGEQDASLAEIAQAYGRYNELADQVDSFTRNQNESFANAINRMKVNITWP